MALTIGGITIDSFVAPPQYSDKYRARSVQYSLNGTALEDRLGDTKKEVKLSFGVISQNVWQSLKAVISQKTFTVSGYVGSLNFGGTYRLADDNVPTPILYDNNGIYMCRPFSITIEEV